MSFDQLPFGPSKVVGKAMIAKHSKNSLVGENPLRNSFGATRPRKEPSQQLQAQEEALLEPTEPELNSEAECDESPTPVTQRCLFALLNAEKREFKKAKKIEAVDTTARADQPVGKLFEPIVFHWPLDPSQELTADLDDFRQRHPEIKVDRPLQAYRDAVRFYLISKATSEIGLLLEARRGQPDYEKFAAETAFDLHTSLQEIARKLAPHDVDLAAILVDAKAEVRAPAGVCQGLRDVCVFAASEAELLTGTKDYRPSVKIFQSSKRHDAEHALGTFCDQHHYDTLIAEDADWYGPGLNGTQSEANIIFKVRKQVFNELEERLAYEGLRAAAVPSQNRGLAAGPRSEHAGGRDWVI